MTLTTGHQAPDTTHQDTGGLVTPAALADKLGISTETVRRWRKSGTLPAPDIQPRGSRKVWWRRSTLSAAGIAI